MQATSIVRRFSQAILVPRRPTPRLAATMQNGLKQALQLRSIVRSFSLNPAHNRNLLQKEGSDVAPPTAG
jgi:hypothetical protein